MPEGEVTVSAQYADAAPVTYGVTVNYGDGSGTYEPGATVTVTAQDRLAENLAFAGWYVESQNTSVNDIMATTAEFVMPEGDVIINATYEEKQIPEGNDPVSDPEPQTPAENNQTQAEPQTPAENNQAPTESQTPAENNQAPTESQTPAENNQTPTESQTPVENNQTPAEPQTPVNEKQTEEEIRPAEEPAEVQNKEENNPSQPSAQTETEPAVLYQVTVENGNGGGGYAAGAAVTIEALPQEGKAFSQWKSSSAGVVFDDPTQPVASFTMPSENVTVTAEYAAATHRVVLENGTDINGAAETSYAENDTVTITAAQAPIGMEFSRWEGTVTANGQTVPLTFGDAGAAQTTFVMPQGDVSVKAVYVEIPKTYLVTVSNGLINDSVTQFACEEGTQVTVSANPSPYGQQFSKWNVNNGAYDLGDAAFQPRVTVTVTENLNFLAVYEGVQYKVTVGDGYSDYDECVAGTVVTIHANDAPKGMEFDCWYVDSQNAALADSYSSQTTFTMPDGDVAVSATYKKVKYQVSVQNGSADQEYYYAGDTVTVSSKYPASGRVFDTWSTVSGTAKFADASRWKTTFTMPAEDVIVAANYKDGPSTDDNVILDLVAGGEYYTGDTIRFTASGAGMSNSNPNPGDYRYRPSGYQIGKVTGTWKGEPYTTSMAINAAGEYTLKVIFNKDIYDGSSWISEGTSDAKSVTFRVVTKAAGVATGDDTPIMLVVGVAVVSCVLFIVLLILFILRRKKR